MDEPNLTRPDAPGEPAAPQAGDSPGVVHEATLVARDGIIVYAGPESRLDRRDVPRGALEVHARGSLA